MLDRAEHVILTGLDLTLDEVVRAARDAPPVALGHDAVERMNAAREVVERAAGRGDVVYGLSTGVGVNRRIPVDPRTPTAAGAAILHEHRVAQGRVAPDDVTRATMVILANGFARGTAGVRPALAERLVDALNAGTLPLVRSLGSIGQADLGPLADLALGIFGDNDVAAGEALALIDNNAFGTASAALAVADAEYLADLLDVAGALSLEAFAANLDHVHPIVAVSRPYAGIRHSLERIRGLLDGSALLARGAARNLQDPTCFRSLPQVNGAFHDALSFARSQLAVELNASQGNPIVVPEEDRLISVANFDVAPVAQSVDLVRVSFATAITSSCERSVKLLDAAWSGLATGLALPGARPESVGIAMLGIAAESLASDARAFGHPVSYDVVSTSEAEGIEDRMTMLPLGARLLADQIDRARRVLAIELAVATRALVLRRPDPAGTGTGRVADRVAEALAWVRTGEGDPDVEPLLDGLARLAPDAGSPHLT
jgi:histidine ammonia-lyase